MNILVIASVLINAIGAVQHPPTSYKIVQQHLPSQSQYTTYYPSKPAFLQYSAGLTNPYVSNAQHSIFR